MLGHAPESILIKPEVTELMNKEKTPNIFPFHMYGVFFEIINATTHRLFDRSV